MVHVALRAASESLNAQSQLTHLRLPQQPRKFNSAQENRRDLTLAV